MSLNETPSANRVHIGFFGRRNAGKSSLVNAVTGQELSIVSEQKGTTTDPVHKAMELLPLGPVVIIDTPGFDDEGELGALRVRKTKQVLNKTDIAVLIVDAAEGLCQGDREMLALFQTKQIPHPVVFNTSDLVGGRESCEEDKMQTKSILDELGNAPYLFVSAASGDGVLELKEKLASLVPADNGRRLVADLVRPLDVVVLVVPIDSAAPKGRLILPQQQVLRDLLDAGAVSVVVREHELEDALRSLAVKPAMVITDSQVFAEVAKSTPENVPLTSFSILMARYKGFLEQAVRGVGAIDRLQDGDTVLIAEGCTHHRQCDDIGTVKIPRWLREHTKKEIQIKTVSGTEFPEDVTPYAVVIHCGGCMLNEREVLYRMKCSVDQGVPFTNYGITIAHMKGILKRSIELFPAISAMLPQ